MVLILETPQGIDNAKAIANIACVDMLLVGANDLSTALGIPGDLRHPRLREAFETAAAACKAQGKMLGIGGARGDLELQRELYGLSGSFVIAGNDVTYLAVASASRRSGAARHGDERLALRRAITRCARRAPCGG